MINLFNEILEYNNTNISEKEIILNMNPFEIISKKKKIIITGIDGQIGYYLKKEYSDCLMFGFVKEINEIEQNVIKIKCNLNDKNELEKFILMIKPDFIIHLAGISSTEACKNDPISSIMINGLVVVYLCDIILKNNLNTKLFNSSSSEVFKGNLVYKIQDNDINHKPTHPYSISKSMSHTMVDWYRNNYNLPFSNGVIFTTESIKRKDSFLTKKCLNHINQLLKGEKTILELGNLEANRSLIHASDVAKAIKIILNQEKGDNYNICSNFFTNIKNYVISLYKFYKINLIEKDSKFYYNDEICIIFNCNQLINNRPDLNIDKNSIILGDNSKLIDLGLCLPNNIDEFLHQIKEQI